MNHDLAKMVAELEKVRKARDEYPEEVMSAVDKLLEQTFATGNHASVTVTVGNITVTATRVLAAELACDNEENTARMADQLVRAAMKEHYNK